MVGYFRSNCQAELICLAALLQLKEFLAKRVELEPVSNFAPLVSFLCRLFASKLFNHDSLVG